LTATDRSAGSDRHAIPDEAGISKRPFANPKRLPGCGPPLRDRCSRPAPSMRLPDSACGPFDCGLPPSPPVSRGGGIHRPQSVAVSVSGTPAGPPGLAPLQDLSILPVRYSTWFTCRKLAYATRTRPVTPLRRWLLSVEAGSPLPVHFVPRDSLVISACSPASSRSPLHRG
jgi:hypothetical protein